MTDTHERYCKALSRLPLPHPPIKAYSVSMRLLLLREWSNLVGFCITTVLNPQNLKEMGWTSQRAQGRECRLPAVPYTVVSA